MINLVNLAVKNFEVASNFCHLNVFHQPCFEVCALINNYVLTNTKMTSVHYKLEEFETNFGSCLPIVLWKVL